MERRQFPRIEIETKISYSVVIPAYEYGTTKDISQGGACLECKRKMAIGTILRLEFDLQAALEGGDHQRGRELPFARREDRRRSPEDKWKRLGQDPWPDGGRAIPAY